jgi:hypothetical protein
MSRLIAATLTVFSLTACASQGNPGTPQTPNPPGGSDAAPLHDTIAYATSNGDEIRLINPDGSGDRPFWAHAQADPEEVYEVWNMAWNKEATELAFSSTHENWCSLYHSDIFSLGADGNGYRRITQAPACAALASYPKGTVQVPVSNPSFETFSGFLYFQGAPSIQPVNLPPNGSGLVTFENVADFGQGEAGLQLATVIVSPYRELLISTAVDVQAGGVVTTPEVAVFTPSASWETWSPSWHVEGSRIAHILNGISLWQLPTAPGALEFGSSLLAEGVHIDGYAGLLAWGPTPARSQDLLYAVSYGSSGVYLVSEGSTDTGRLLADAGASEAVFGLAWLPDGSGFVYAATEGEYFGENRSSNLFLYDFASQQSTRVTSFVGDFVGQVSVSGDGQRFVFERADNLNDSQSALVAPDLWLVNRDGSGLIPLVENAYAPAWSP